MSSVRAQEVVVVDGSNIATEGRSKPSLRQLSDAVTAFMEERPDAAITVVVDATFGHRIDASEVAEFDAGVANNELVTPPAGAIGRGDAFVLSIAHKVGAQILSNDSFQEFHGDYGWLFDEGRLIGGKPVPNIGWVFVERLPVRGSASRKSSRATSTRRGRTTKAATTTTTASDERAARAKAMADGRLPPAPPSRGGRSGRSKKAPAAAEVEAAVAEVVAEAVAPAAAERGSTMAPEAVNEIIPFLEFVERHPVGTSVNAVAESYSSHGAYVTIDSVRGYVPLQLIDDPAPRSARKVMAIGDALTLVVASYSPLRRSIDLAFPAMVASLGLPEPAAPPSARPARKRLAKKAASTGEDAADRSPAKQPAATKPAATRKKAVAVPATKKAATKKAATKKSAASPAAKKAATKKAATKKAATKKAATKKPAAKKEATKKAATKRAGTKKAAASPAATTKRSAPPRKVTAKQATARKATAGTAGSGRPKTQSVDGDEPTASRQRRTGRSS